MELSSLKQQLESLIDEVAREALIATVVARASREELVAVAALLVDKSARVREGAIEILSRARFQPAAGALLAVAKARSGHERALALRALLVVTGPADEGRVLDGARALALASGGDDDVRAAAEALVDALVERQGAPRAGAVTTFGLLSPDKEKRRAALVRTLKEHPNPTAAIVDGLLETRSSVVRMDLLAGLGTLGAGALADAALKLLAKADADLVALVARHLEQKLREAPVEIREPLAKAILVAGARAATPLARAATDACALALLPALAAGDQARRVGDLDAEDLERLKDAIVSLDEPARDGVLKALVQGLAKHPERAGAFAEVLYADLGRLDYVQRATLLTVATRAASASGDDADLARHLGPLARLLSRLVPRGGAMPAQLVVGLRLSPQPTDRFALVELCSALATEEAADALKKLYDGHEEEVRRRAEAALRAFSSDEVEVRLHPGAVELLPRRVNARGERLLAQGRFLVDQSGVLYVLSADGTPVPNDETPFGGCRCCFRPRALERAPEGEEHPRPACAVTGKRHLVDPAEGPLLEESHPLGGCLVCDTVRPLVREGPLVVCPSCQTPYERKGERYQPRRDARPTVVVTASFETPSATIPKVDDAPKPPSDTDLAELLPEVKRAMEANVVLVGRGSFRMWGASGVVVAKQGNELAILTSRHAVEETTGEHAGQRVPLSCFTIAGEECATKVVWVASLGLDLALLSATVAKAAAVDVIELSRGRAARLGEEIFAVGNALGLPWSYSTGPVSSLRTLPTRQGLDVRFLQTTMNLAAGTGGGGVYLKDGALAGIVSWYRGTGSMSETNFAISVDSVIAGLRRERVRFGGAPLCSSE